MQMVVYIYRATVVINKTSQHSCYRNYSVLGIYNDNII